MVPMFPPDLAPLAITGLVALSFFTSAVTAAIGLGGGLMLLAVMASVLPPATLLPVHGIVQIGSNVGRAALMRGSIGSGIVLPFTVGAVIGAALGARVFVALPVGVLQAAIALFILYSVWAPRLRLSRMPRSGFLPVGVVTTFLTMFVGGTGPLVAAFVSSQPLDREGIVATHAACMSVQHSFKVVTFGFIGFHLLPWLPLAAAMIAAGFAGTVLGRRILLRLPEQTFRWLFRVVLTLLAARMLIGGVMG